LLSSSFDGTVKSWSVATGQLLMDLHRGTSGVSDMDLSADGGRLAVVEDRQRVWIYQIGL
jgi:WD40 repeat protein